MAATSNIDLKTVEGFGDEWQSFDHGDDTLSTMTREQIFDAYFAIFPWTKLPENAEGADLGCGSGRWAALIAPKVGKLHAVDASASALAVAKKNLSTLPNVEFHHCDVSQLSFLPKSLDFAFSLGVLHHLPDTQRAISDIAKRLKPGAPFLVYLYYSMDNRPVWFRSIWVMTDWLRFVISRLPHVLKIAITTALAALVYWPLARAALLFEKLGFSCNHIPLAFYRDKPFYVLRTDAYDRFATRLERRFTKPEIEAILLKAGFTDIHFSDREPYWCAVGTRVGG
ncbi:MAG: class I SAM-dependent methyltransferase [Xanthobacteraceae bacterium]